MVVLLPGFVIYTVFFALPTLSALFLSTTDWNGLSSQFSFVGFQNFKEILTNDAIFTQSLTNNLKFTIGVLIFQTLLSLGFALLLYRNSAWNTFYRSLFFVPTIISSVSIAFTWNFMYDPNIGGVNLFLSKIGLKRGHSLGLEMDISPFTAWLLYNFGHILVKCLLFL